MDTYILQDRVPVPCSAEEWTRSFSGDLRVRSDTVGCVAISTVFLGLDHNWGGDGPPLLFETMIFGGKHDSYYTRCSTWEQAEQQHAEAVALVRGSSGEQ